MMELVWALLSIGGFSSTIIVLLAWLVRNFLRTKTGKTIDAAKADKKSSLVLASSLGHHAKLMKTREFTSGALETAKFSQRTKRRRKVFYSPKRREIELTEKDIKDVKKRLLTQECLNNILKLNTEKLFLEGGIPLTIALDDKVITTGVKGIGALNYFEKLCKIADIKELIQKLKNNETFKAVGVYLEKLASQVTLIDIEVLRNYFDADHDQIDEEAQNEFYYMQGYRDGQKKEHGIEKMIVIGGIAIGIIGIVGGVVMMFLGR